MKYYIIAGEASGDLHGSNLIKQLHHLDQNAIINCWGGNLMQQAGSKLIKHYKDLAFMGFVEVIKNLPIIIKNIKFCKQDILLFKPDALILVDYPGFNLRIADWAKQQGFKVFYYISPQVWAWKSGRVKKMKQCIDEMICILPFEKEYYQTKWNWNVHYVGHPLTEAIENFKAKNNIKQTDSAKVIALLPGSRKQEIIKKLPIMLQVAKHFKEQQFSVAKAPGLEDEFYHQFLPVANNVTFIRNDTYNLLLQSKAALVTSGTATLETALFHVPEVVCYKGSNISYQIAKRVIKIKYISLVNLIMNKLVVKELIQNQLTVTNLVTELKELLYNKNKIQQLQEDYNALHKLLSTKEIPSYKAAKIITESISS
jgi:lipid-A-disaccharide synthase